MAFDIIFYAVRKAESHKVFMRRTKKRMRSYAVYLASSQAYALGDHDIYGCVLMKELDITSDFVTQSFAEILLQDVSHVRNLKQTVTYN